MKKFHITIKDNETGETLHDLDTAAIVGSFENGDSVTTLGLTRCKPSDIVCTVAAAKLAVHLVTREDKRAGKLSDKMLKKYKKINKKETKTWQQK